MDATKRLWTHCGACDHTWSAARLPMEGHKFGKIMDRLICPNCAETGEKLFMATQAQVDKAIADLRAELAT